LGNSYVAKRLAASQERLSAMELIVGVIIIIIIYMCEIHHE
jgi:hypothetical protein